MIDYVNKKTMFKEIFEVILFTVTFVFLAGILPSIALFGFGVSSEEVNNVFQSVLFYGGLGGLFALALVLMRFWEMFLRRSNNRELYDSTGFISARLHDPEKSVLAKLLPNIVSYLSIGNVIVFSFIFFSLIGLFGVLQNSFFVAIPNFVGEQQFTKTGTIILAGEPAASVETVMWLFIASIILGIVDWLENTSKVSVISGWILRVFVFIPIFVGSWVLFHFARYGSDETKIFGTAMFGLSGALSILIIGSFLPWYIFHFINNTLQRANGTILQPGLFPDEIIVVFVGTIIASLLIMRVIAYLITSKKFSNLSIE